MKRDIYLHGAAGREHGRHFRLDVNSPAEAIRALITLRPALREKMRVGWWRVIVGRPHIRNAIPLDVLNMSMGSQALHIVPATPPAGGGGLWTTIGTIALGVALIAASFIPGLQGLTIAAGVSLTGTLLSAGIGITISGVLSGVAGLLTSAPTDTTPTDRARPDDRPSFLFNGVTNTSQPGAPVPLVFGRHLVGSIVVSAGLTAEDIAP